MSGEDRGLFTWLQRVEDKVDKSVEIGTRTATALESLMLLRHEERIRALETDRAAKVGLYGGLAGILTAIGYILTAIMSR